MKNYPNLTPASLDDVLNLLRYITKERPIDIKDFDNLQNVFMAGRKVGKMPTGSADVTPDDRVGDFNYDASYLYLLVNNAGTATWRRVALSSW